MIELVKEQLKKNSQIDHEELENEENEEKKDKEEKKEKIVKLGDKFTKNDIEIFKTRRAIKKFHTLLRSMKNMKIKEGDNEGGIKRGIIKAALKQIVPYEGIITQAFSQVLEYRAQGLQIPASRLLNDIQKALTKDIKRLDHLNAILSNHSLSERNYEDIRELIGIEVVVTKLAQSARSSVAPNRKSMLSQVDSLMHIR